MQLQLQIPFSRPEGFHLQELPLYLQANLYQFQMCRTDFTTWITETLYTHCLQVRYIPSFLAGQLCTLCHHYLVFLYMWLSVVAVILFSFVFCLILVILLSAPKSKSTNKSILLLHIQSMSKC